MGIFRRRKGGSNNGLDVTSETQDVSYEPNAEQTEQAKEVMKDNLELMKEVVMRIREDPEFASNIYAECPRLQHLLDQYPDLRPIFEDPKLVRINFEQVYRDAGGVLPEDEKKQKSWLVWLVNSPIFKILKLLLFVKKLVTCIAGGGFAMVSGCIMGCCFEDALEELADEDDVDVDGETVDPAKEALNRAADRMEDPQVQEQMQALLEDPDNLQEAIENDPELKALRDSSPLCEELMSDPETMRVLTDPDNLRALGEAPSLVQADFIDPDGFMPSDIETGALDGYGEGGYDAFDGGDDMDFAEADADFDLDVDDDVDIDDGFDGDEDVEAEAEAEAFDDEEFEAEVEEEEEEDGGWWEDAEMEEQEGDNDATDGRGDTGDNGENRGEVSRGQEEVSRGQEETPRGQDDTARARKVQARKANQSGQQNGEKTGRFGGIMASIGVAATDLIAAQIVGNVFDATGAGDLLGGGGGGGDMDGGAYNGITDNVGEIADDAGNVIDDDVAGVAEEIKDEVHEKADEKDGDNSETGTDNDGKKNAAPSVAVAAGGGVAAVGSAGRGKANNVDDENEERDIFDDEAEPEEGSKKGRFAFIGNLASAISTTAKQTVAGALLGDDFGEALVERIDGGGEEDDKAKQKKEGGQEEAQQENSTSRLFGRGKNKTA